MFKWFLSLLLTTQLYAAELRLKDKLAEAEVGSYIVTQQSKSFTFLYVHDRDQETIMLEEVTIPEGRFASHPMPWRQWFESGAPGHTCWLVSRINLQSGRFEETYSYTHQGWLDLNNSNTFLSTLLNLPFFEVPPHMRRRVGLAPGIGRPDQRPLWNPRLIVDGCAVQSIPFTVWKTKWPNDGSDLSNKVIEIYLPCIIDDPNFPKYPAYFPYWIEVESKIGSARVRIVDSGLHACSPQGIFRAL